jgi:hypothetical protein
MNIVDVSDIYNVGDVRYVSDVTDVHATNVVFPAVIPGKERFTRPQRKPGAKTGHGCTDGH